MTEPSYDLLTSRLISAIVDDKRTSLTLPGVLAALGHAHDVTFPALRAHQEQSWFTLLAQLGVLCWEHDDRVDLRCTEDVWRERLLALSSGDAGAWHLVNPDVTRAAFLQAPNPPGADELRDEDRTPDRLDMLVTSKNHDLKGERMTACAPEHWLFALVSLQTMEGFGGKSNYGIARMNSGFGSRPFVGWTSDLRWPHRFSGDVAVSHAWLRRADVPTDVRRLLWLTPWDGRDSLADTALHPLGVEICRRIRLVNSKSGIIAKRRGTLAPRIDAKARLGAMDDPWTPVEISRGAALNIQDRGFHVGLTLALLTSQDYRAGAASDPSRGATSGWFIAQGIARGQGGTQGVHERTLPIPAAVAPLFTAPDQRMKLGTIGMRLLHDQDTMRGKVLFPALCRIVNAGAEKRSTDFDVNRWTRAFDARCSEVFFAALWDAAGSDNGETGTAAWSNLLKQEASATLERAIREAPTPDSRRYRAIAEAESVFRAAMNKHFPQPEASTVGATP